MRTLLLLVLLSIPSVAHAGGLALPNIGPSNTGVTTPGPVSVHLNPAGLGYSRKPRLVIGGNLIGGALRYQRQRLGTYQTPDSLDFQLPIDPGSVDASKTGKDRQSKAHPIGLVPSFFLELPLWDLPLSVGVGIDAPYAAIVRWPGAGPQRFALDNATLLNVFTNVGISWRVLDKLSIGAGVAYVLGYADLSRTQDLAGVGELGAALGRPPINQPNGFGSDADPALRELDTFSRPFHFQNGWSSGVTFRAGFMAEPLKNLWVAASYEHSTKLHYNGSFQLDMDNPFFTQDLASQGLDYPGLVRGDASLTITLPKVVRGGVRYGFGPKVGDAPKYGVALEGTFTGWSSVDNFDVRLRSAGLAQPMLGLGRTLRVLLPRDWRNTYALTVRGTLAVTRRFSMWGSVNGESAAAPSRTVDAAGPDNTRFVVAGGLSGMLIANVRILLDLTVQTMLRRTVLDSDYDLANGTYRYVLVSGGAWLDYAF
ncbi:MAG TPA: outer membrane protein transport protein [Polyangiales bacterium]|nr:outer membrane protein transport protein [Polyangiales bacterium]